MSTKKSIFLCFLFFFSSLYSQDKPKDIDESITNSFRYFETNLDSAYYFLNIAHKKSIAISNDSLAARCLSNIGFYFSLKGNPSEAKKYYYQSIKLCQKSNYYKVWSANYLYLGVIYKNNNQYNEALKLYFKALDIAHKNKVYLIKSRVLINLGDLYLIQNDTMKSLYHFNQNIINAEKNNFSRELSTGYMNSAILYAQRNPKKAEELYKKALQIAEKEDNLTLQKKLHINFSNLYLKDKKKLALVYNHLQKAEKLQQLLEDETSLFYIYFNYASYYSQKKQETLALKYYNNALEASENAPSDRVLALYAELSETYKDNKDYKNALLYKEKFNLLSDSIFTIEKNKNFSEIETKYEVEKKNLKIGLLTKEKEIEKGRKKLVLIISIIIVIALLLVILFFKNRMKTQKIIREKENLIHQQQLNKISQDQEIERIKNVIVGQNTERNRLAKEIHDGIGGELAGIKMGLTLVNKNLEDKKINAIIKQLGKVFKDLREVSHNLSINSISDKSLYELVSNLVESHNSKNKFKIELVVYPLGCLDEINEEIKINLYRIFQELLTNITKHAKAKNVTISITDHTNELNIIVEDDGVGIDLQNKNGIGIKNIEERIAIIGAEILFESQKNKGTTVIVNLPKYHD